MTVTVTPEAATGVPEKTASSLATSTDQLPVPLDADDYERIGVEFDRLRREVMDSLGAADARYIRTLISAQRALDAVSRLLLLFSKNPVCWVLGTTGLSVAKILENTEIGHNVLHGQWDWMKDPKIHSTTWEWDFASPAYQWKRSHNVGHHTYTNVIGKDNDLGYNFMRLDPAQEWKKSHLAQIPLNLLNAAFFEYGIALYDLETAEFKAGTKPREEFLAEARVVSTKAARQLAKDYMVLPVLSGTSALHTLAATAVANLVRNVWTHTVIFCGHFPDGVQTFEVKSIDGETRGQWYVRQMLGSANISGGRITHLMTGNLSHQIEHHLFPDMPSNRLITIAPRVRAVMDRYHLPYVTGPIWKQAASAWRKVARYSLPNPDPALGGGRRSQLRQVWQSFRRDRATGGAGLTAHPAAAGSLA